MTTNKSKLAERGRQFNKRMAEAGMQRTSIWVDSEFKAQVAAAAKAEGMSITKFIESVIADDIMANAQKLQKTNESNSLDCDELAHDVDVSVTVRKEIAIQGNDKHRDVLVNDDDALVRAAVAKYGNDKHREQLAEDAAVQSKVRFV